VAAVARWRISNEPCTAGVALDNLAPGQSIRVPVTLALGHYRQQRAGSGSGGGVPDYLRHGAVGALAHATAAGSIPSSGLVAVKVRSPGQPEPACPCCALS
jgi:hypothetical protein